MRGEWRIGEEEFWTRGVLDEEFWTRSFRGEERRGDERKISHVEQQYPFL